MYWKLKTQALEETLLDITFSDEVEANVSANCSTNEVITSETFTNNQQSTLNNLKSPGGQPNLSDTLDSTVKDSENIAPEQSPLKDPRPKSPTKNDSINVEGAWGEHLNKDNEFEKKKKSLPIGRTSSFQLSQKMFTSSSFTKRNPRKSLSMSRSKSKNDLNNSNISLESTKSTEGTAEKPEKSLFGTSIKISDVEQKITAQPLNLYQRLLNGAPQTVERNLNAGWLDRRTKETNLDQIVAPIKRLSGVSDSGIESMDATDKPREISDDEDFVCNSDTEEEYRNKRIRNWRRTLPEITSQPAKKPRMDDTEERSSTPIIVQIDKNALVKNLPNTIAQKSVENSQLNNSEPNVQHQNTINNAVKATLSALERKKSNKIDSEDEEEKPKTRKSARAVRSKTSTVKKSNTTVSKTRKSTRRVTKKAKKTSESTDEESSEMITHTNPKASPEIPIYGIESLDVVPRYPVPRDTHGDLVSEFSESVVGESTAVTTTTKPKGPLTAREKLEAKMASGKANENFVRINLKKKIYVRGKKHFNFSTYKKNEWKKNKNSLASSEGALDLADLAEKNSCFKCGGSGHVSRKCPAMKSDELLPVDETPEASQYPTLEEAEQMASQEALRVHAHRIKSLPGCSNLKAVKTTVQNPSEEDEINFEDEDFDESFELEPEKPMVGHKIPKDLIDKLLPPINGVIDPLYPDPNIETPAEVINALKMFGHESFRPGQEKAIMRILSGQSTLVTLSTGSGKSLCYQLPAYLYAKKSHCITLVVSPLVSLMDDQVTGVPGFISAAALHTGQTPRVRDKIMETIKEGKLDILLVSPEAIVAGEKSTGFGSLLRQLPPIAFACIDEAHCISQWSHNFRPSYLMVCRVLMEKMGVKTILGLTATATRSTAESIVNHLKIHDGMSGVISDTPLPNNLILTISKDDHRDRALIDLLCSKRFEECDSIIIYCTRRDECTRIAGLVRVSLQPNSANTTTTKAKVSAVAEAYHAGLPAGRRKVIQKAFMNGNTRVVVATVAFGMGINKSNIRSVIHYNMPSSFEGYVQEVGRAGRDNLPAHCHLFLSPIKDSDKWELRRHIYADGVDRHTIRRLLQRIFIPCACKETGRKCPGHEVAISVDETVNALDISEETIATLLCYLELHPKKFITVLSSVYVRAKVSSYSGARALKIAAQSSPPLAMAIALDRKKGINHDDDTVIEFAVVDVAAAIGWDSGVVKSHLKNLEWTTVDGKYQRTAISVRYDTLGLRVRAPGDLTDTELDEALDALAERTKSQQVGSLQQLEVINAVLNKYCHNNVRDCMELSEESVKNSEELKSRIRDYFQSSNPLEIIELPADNNGTMDESQIVADIRNLICSYRDNNFYGRAVARIFYGIQSPNYSALAWSRCRFWRAHLPVDFNWIAQIATREILAMR